LTRQDSEGRRRKRAGEFGFYIWREGAIIQFIHSFIHVVVVVVAVAVAKF